MPDDFSQPDPEEKISVPVPAADRAGVPHEFQGRAIEPFSVRRQIAAQAMGNKLLSGTAKLEVQLCECGCKPQEVAGEVVAEEDDEKPPNCPLCRDAGRIFGMYDGMFADVVAVLYLCVCPITAVLKAVRKPDEIMGRALEWAEQQEISVGSPAFHAASLIYGQILNDLSAAQFKVVSTPGGAAPKNEPGGPLTAA